MTARTSRRAYKELRLQQLRSICETARLGSLAAAAKELGVSQPAVWEQVHSLERELAMPLIEPHGRGCRLTQAGSVLVELAVPVVANADALKRAFQERMAQVEVVLTVAAPQRILVEDLSDVITAFMRDHPQVRLRLLERITGRVATTVDAGEADLGVDSEQQGSNVSPRLQWEAAYELDVLLLTPRDHPLARRPSVRPRDLRGFPLINAPEDIAARPAMLETLRKLDLFQGPRRPIEAVSTAVIRHFVGRGFGMGLVLGRLSNAQHSVLHERSMSRYFGSARIGSLWRRGIVLTHHARLFVEAIQKQLNA